MAEILPNGTLQGYSNICPDCKKTIQVNMQGTPINHKCEFKNLDIPHVIKSVCRVCKSDKLHDFVEMIQCQQCGAVQ